jgi:predicted metal-dependent HD superfamily phosphohydrolase
MTLQDRWFRLMDRLNLPPSEDQGAHLLKAYSERHRHYHTVEHLEACLAHLDEHWGEAARPELIEIALWFHDAVYRPMSKTNEADSAALARRFLAGQMDEARIEWVETAIQLTQNHGETDDPDTKLLLDIDLAILGAPPHVYETYVGHVRREFRWVPRPMFRKGRARILRHFLDMPQIYKTDRLAALLESRARDNLSGELRRIG